MTIGARDPERLGAVVHGLQASGATEVVAVAGDLGSSFVVDQLVDAHADSFGTLDVLVLNAGFGSAGAMANYPKRRFDKSIDVNLRAPAALLQRALPLFRNAAADQPTCGVKVVAIDSITGVHAEVGLSVCGATMAALISLMDAVNVEEFHHGVTASAIAPASVDTDIATWIHDEVVPETMIQVDDILALVVAVIRLSSPAVVPKLVVRRAGTNS